MKKLSLINHELCLKWFQHFFSLSLIINIFVFCIFHNFSLMKTVGKRTRKEMNNNRKEKNIYVHCLSFFFSHCCCCAKKKLHAGAWRLIIISLLRTNEPRFRIYLILGYNTSDIIELAPAAASVLGQEEMQMGGKKNSKTGTETFKWKFQQLKWERNKNRKTVNPNLLHNREKL